MKNLYVSGDIKNKINKKLIHELVFSLKKELNFNIESLGINIVSQNLIHDINKKYLKHDFTTDIITFNYSGDNNNFDGEIFISLIDANMNAGKFGVSLQLELTRLIIHGILHLLGYDDMEAKDKKVMKKLENELVDKFDSFGNKNLVEYDG